MPSNIISLSWIYATRRIVAKGWEPAPSPINALSLAQRSYDQSSPMPKWFNRHFTCHTRNSLVPLGISTLNVPVSLWRSTSVRSFRLVLYLTELSVCVSTSVQSRRPRGRGNGRGSGKGQGKEDLWAFRTSLPHCHHCSDTHFVVIASTWLVHHRRCSMSCDTQGQLACGVSHLRVCQCT